MRFTCGAKKAPAGCSKGGGPGGVATPDLLERYYVGADSQPLDNLTNWCACPREAVNIVCCEPQHPLLGAAEEDGATGRNGGASLAPLLSTV